MGHVTKLTTKDIKRFEAALRREANVLFPQYIKNVTAGVVAALYTGIVQGTPVLTGRARKNWFVTFSAPSTRVIDPDQKIQTEGYWFPATGAPLSSDERDTLTKVTEAIKKGPVNRKVHITNNLAYISVLEDGWSGKAPAGMVEITRDWVTGSGAQRRIAIEALAQL